MIVLVAGCRLRVVMGVCSLQASQQVAPGAVWLHSSKYEGLRFGLDERRIELPKLMDRFPLQVHLEPSETVILTSIV
jgi:hypothetical protein